MTEFDPRQVGWFRDLESQHGPEVIRPGTSGEVRYTLDASDPKCPVGVVAMDDGKMNAFSFSMIARLNLALDVAEKDECKSIVIKGNSKVFSSGFDLGTMRAGDYKLMVTLVNLGGLFAYRVFGYAKPVVLAATGHALAMGAILLFAGDSRIGLKPVSGEKSPKVGLNEVAIGMSLPEYAIRLSRRRVPITYQTRILSQAWVGSPEQAIPMGFIDAVAEGVQGVEQAALKEAQRLGSYLKQPAFKEVKLLDRGPCIQEGVVIINSLASKL